MFFSHGTFLEFFYVGESDDLKLHGQEIEDVQKKHVMLLL